MLAGILTAVAVVGVLGLLIGLFLGVAGKKFQVDVDEKEQLVRALLPGNNCGGCGFPGCDGLAAAIASGSAAVNACPVGGAEVAQQIAKVMGVEGAEAVRMTAFVRCSGSREKTVKQYEYYGEMDCRQVFVVPGHGDKRCSYGCLGYGSCQRTCPFDAIHVVDGVAVVDAEACKACGKCMAVCPNHLIELVPYGADYLVRCSSRDKGKNVRAACEAGCIGCTLCTKVCESGAITVTNSLAHIDYAKCTGCGKCAEKCPAHVIVMR
ncbi:RnfABCDGE type electron transport complex subunit B [Cuneatibacter caecimuris]|uniref:Ion-translocating oxidoreductase complex subunit B n=1 Tax=Cuneatibacter caecimuris TaxID=1796618 RepID=A0A4Q7P2Y1_9FIRM|nr:RnfABCDGE type electron transport complex subunit B [Cuneatibacter caecimuris]RZS93022.1 RnfABCDGE-type electron transport complex B subunit [Cuneatibacter caecimuris]